MQPLEVFPTDGTDPASAPIDPDAAAREYVRRAAGGPARGMTVLDTFAAHALAGILAAHDHDRPFPDDDDAARWAYGFAAAMVERRRDLTGQWETEAGSGGPVGDPGPSFAKRAATELRGANTQQPPRQRTRPRGSGDGGNGEAVKPGV